MLNAMDAADKSAAVFTQPRCVSTKRMEGDWLITTCNDITGEESSYKARVLVNAVDPWVKHIINDVILSHSTCNIKLIKGSHLIVPKFWEGRHAYLAQNHDKRVIFIKPYDGKIEDVTADESEIN